MNAAKNNKKFTKPVNKTFSLIVSGKDNHGHDYDPDSAIELIDDLVKNDVFTKLSIMASVANAALMGKEDARGMRNVARITTVNCEDKTVDMDSLKPSSARMLKLPKSWMRWLWFLVFVLPVMTPRLRLFFTLRLSILWRPNFIHIA